MLNTCDFEAVYAMLENITNPIIIQAVCFDICTVYSPILFRISYNLIKSYWSLVDVEGGGIRQEFGELNEN